MNSEALRFWPKFSTGSVLDDDAVFRLVVDDTVLDPREALHEMGNSSKDGVGIMLVTREALNKIGSFFLQMTTLQFVIHWESLR